MSAVVASLDGAVGRPRPGPKVADERNARRILPGEYYVTDKDELITTVLGSCISACIRDTRLGVGGMNHFMLPKSGASGETGAAARYGVFAMEHLINDILKLGGNRNKLEVKVFGGGNMMSAMKDIGGQNIAFVREFLAAEGYTIVSEDMGLTYPRKVNYYPKSGRVMVKRLRSMHKRTILESEGRYSRSIAADSAGGDVELF